MSRNSTRPLRAWRRCRSSALPMVLGLAAACSAEPQSPASPLAGTWVAELPSQTLLAITLSVRNAEVTGSGNLAGLLVASPIHLTITGTYVDPSVTLFLDTQAEAMVFHGTLTPPVLVGTLNGLFYSDLGVRFRRQ